MKKKVMTKKAKKVETKKTVKKAAAKVPVKVPVVAQTKAMTSVPAPAPTAVSASIPAPVKNATNAGNAAPTKIIVPAPVLKKHILYVEVSPDKYFVLCDGRKIKSGKELADVLQLISDDMFKYHVTDTKNDFSNWINDVFGEPELAKKMRTIRNRMEMSMEIYRNMFDKLEKLSRQK